MNTNETHICRPSVDDLATIYEIHKRAFPGFFLTALGPVFLKGYYRAMLLKKDTIFLVERADEIIGFACGLEDAASFNFKYMKKNIKQLAFSVCLAVTQRPSILFRVFTRPQDARKQPHRLGMIHLLSIAVDPKASGHGTGSRLLEAFKTEALKRSFSEVYLTTDANGNEKANAFYLKNGFRKINSHSSGNGRLMNEYICSLNHLK